jgi:hypothetical protein
MDKAKLGDILDEHNPSSFQIAVFFNNTIKRRQYWPVKRCFDGPGRVGIVSCRVTIRPGPSQISCHFFSLATMLRRAGPLRQNGGLPPAFPPSRGTPPAAGNLSAPV